MLNRIDQRTRLIRNRRFHKRAGMTLVEIMIVVIIMALIATGVAIAVLPNLERAKVDNTRTRAATIRSAATMYIAQTPGADCPSVQDLMDDGMLDDNTDAADGWGHDFTIECAGNNIDVVSAGADGEFGTEDDIQ